MGHDAFRRILFFHFLIILCGCGDGAEFHAIPGNYAVINEAFQTPASTFDLGFFLDTIRTPANDNQSLCLSTNEFIAFALQADPVKVDYQINGQWINSGTYQTNEKIFSDYTTNFSSAKDYKVTENSFAGIPMFAAFTRRDVLAHCLDSPKPVKTTAVDILTLTTQELIDESTNVPTGCTAVPSTQNLIPTGTTAIRLTDTSGTSSVEVALNGGCTPGVNADSTGNPWPAINLSRASQDDPRNFEPGDYVSMVWVEQDSMGASLTTSVQRGVVAKIGNAIAIHLSVMFYIPLVPLGLDATLWVDLYSHQVLIWPDPADVGDYSHDQLQAAVDEYVFQSLPINPAILNNSNFIQSEVAPYDPMFQPQGSSLTSILSQPAPSAALYSYSYYEPAAQSDYTVSFAIDDAYQIYYNSLYAFTYGPSDGVQSMMDKLGPKMRHIKELTKNKDYNKDWGRFFASKEFKKKMTMRKRHYSTESSGLSSDTAAYPFLGGNFNPWGGARIVTDFHYIAPSADPNGP